MTQNQPTPDSEVKKTEVSIKRRTPDSVAALLTEPSPIGPIGTKLRSDILGTGDFDGLFDQSYDIKNKSRELPPKNGSDNS